MKEFRHPAVSKPLAWQIEPAEWRIEGDDGLLVRAGQNTDLFCDPNGDAPIDTAPRALFPLAGDAILSACIEVDFDSVYDAGVLLVYAGATRWAKLCFEYSPQCQPTVVSVVTRDLSDDCNGMSIFENRIFLRVSSIGQALAFHFSNNGRFWQLVRYFSLGSSPAPQIGFAAQSPTGEGCRVRFSEIKFSLETLSEIRSGV